MAAGSQTGREPGSLAGARTFQCVDCSYAITLLRQDDVPPCPRCGGTTFAPASMFSEATSQVSRTVAREHPTWLDEVRESLVGKGPHLAFDEDDNVKVVALPEGFLRLGRSIQADLHLAGPTVSRRHALIHREGTEVTVVDDHSLNGVFVDGEQVDWQRLEDGNELELGGFCLYFVSL